MTNLVPQDRFFQDLFDFRRDFDQIFNRILLGKPLLAERFVPDKQKEYDFLPAIETYLDKDQKKFICRVALPGIDPKNVEIHTNDNLLTIKGERKLTRASKEVNLWDEEIVYGSFERTLDLPEGVVIDKLTAEYQNGMLEITAPVAAVAMPRKVEIKVAPIAKQIAA
ncbi:MAG TPA: Hsp20/alpha crystallin family protein [Candidatus Acidoferrales bacterium]|nr:Hsp20/alpha crystallin family protein [Candidatus Acidoferrales bacterium]